MLAFRVSRTSKKDKNHTLKRPIKQEGLQKEFFECAFIYVLAIKPHAVQALLQQVVDVAVVGNVLHIGREQLRLELYSLASTGLTFLPVVGSGWR